MNAPTIGDPLAIRNCADYLDELALSPQERQNVLQALLEQAMANDPTDDEAMMASLHRLLAELPEKNGDPAKQPQSAQSDSSEVCRASEVFDPAYVSIGTRIQRHYQALDIPGQDMTGILHRDALGRIGMATQPPLNRSSMAPSGWKDPRPHDDNEDSPPTTDCDDATVPTAPEPQTQWHRSATRRRLGLLALIITQTYLATNAMVSILPYHGGQWLEIPILILFAILFGWVSAGFWTALAGFVLLLLGRDRYAITGSLRYDGEGCAPIAADARTAIIMPICNEDVKRVFAGLRATFESLQKTGQLDRFDFFVLSDSYRPDIRVAEHEAWANLCHQVGGFGQIFYRWRQHRIKRKSGNVADFCRRWGNDYRYMIVLDADSVMTGDCLTALVRMAEAHPNAGIIQTAPRAAGRETFYARMQQFATCAYGPLFTAGLHFWQLGESHYWGHNAIIRVAPFMRHCALARLPGRGALAGEILSHDFVEAALMRRAGWAVWIAYDLPGSYEEMPPNLIDELSRDRRWCQGNLMNFRLFFMQGLHPAHRAVFMTGVMAYLSAPLWFAFLLLSTALLAVHTLTVPVYFTAPHQLFPIWPEWHTEWAIGLSCATFFCLFLPKILSVLLLMRHDAAAFGGRLRLALSMPAELIMSALLAPIRMLFHTQFVVGALLGLNAGWRSPAREDAQTTWGEAIRRHGLHTLLGCLWAGFVGWLSPSYLWWLLPVVGALLLSIPISVYTSRVTLGQRTRERGFFLIPEETAVPDVIAATIDYNSSLAKPAGMKEAVLDPFVNALICATRTARKNISTAMREQREQLLQTAFTRGLAALTDAQQNRVISDPVLLSALHRTLRSTAHQERQEKTG